MSRREEWRRHAVESVKFLVASVIALGLAATLAEVTR